MMGAESECDGHNDRGADIVVENTNGVIVMEEDIHWNLDRLALMTGRCVDTSGNLLVRLLLLLLLLLRRRRWRC